MAIDLITNARARVALPSAASSGADDTAINTLITACSRAIMRYCRRSFVSDTYDEIYSGRGESILQLRNYPIQSVTFVRCRPGTVLLIQNTSPSNQIARVEVLAAGLRLTRIASGAVFTDTSTTWALNTTLTAVKTAVNALGNGWSAELAGDFSGWPSADLYCPNGSTTDAAPAASQGALNAAGQFAEVQLHTGELSGYEFHSRTGGLLRSHAAADPWAMPVDVGVWPAGVDNLRVKYTAGFATVPEDVQEACGQLVAHHFRLGARETPDAELPAAVARLLSPYRMFKTHGS